ncbi:MAG: SgcJ/EcaC family oxidoreductase [Nitrososphaeraceae archaeon]
MRKQPSETFYQKTINGWNKGRGDAFAVPYSEDSDFVGFDGTYMKRRQQIASFHQEPFDKFLKGSRLIGKIKSIRFVTIDVAIMIAIGGTVMAGQSDIEPERNSIHTIVAVKRDSNWCFTAFQNSRVQYIGRPEESRALTEELQQELSKISKENMVD